MLARPHAVIGAAFPVGFMAHGVSVPQCAAMAVVSAGFALGPDLDTPSSTASKALPAFVHRATHSLSSASLASRRLSTGLDKRDFAWRARNGRDPAHRSLTHTAVCALAVGLAVSAAATTQIGAALVAALAAWVMRRLLPGRPVRALRHHETFRRVGWLGLLSPAAAGALAWTADPGPVLTGVAAFLGWLSAVLADGCTKDGVPLAWPFLTVKGKRWWRFRFLGTRLETGGPGEWWVVFAVTAIFVVVPFQL